MFKRRNSAPGAGIRCLEPGRASGRDASRGAVAGASGRAAIVGAANCVQTMTQPDSQGDTTLKKILDLVAAGALLCAAACAEKPKQEPAAEAAPATTAQEAAAPSEGDLLHKADPIGEYGAGIVLTAETPLTSVIADPAGYEGKIVQVQGRVAEVCPRRGCWIDLAVAGSDKKLRVKVTDGQIVFPLSAKDHTAKVEGVIEKIEMSEEQNRAWQAHLAEERGEAFDSTSVKGPATLYQLTGLGAQIDS